MDKEKNSILIVDDQKTTIMVLKNILGGEYRVFTTENGQDALKAAERFKPDVILLDILMMDINGYTVLAELRNSEITRDIPVIFITSLNDVEDEEKGLSLGAADYITKPFSPEIVRLRIQNQIRMLNQLQTSNELSMLDQLTQLPNRRSFEMRINTEWAVAQREKKPISILMIDLDKFKNYNDTYGHLQGDIALKTTAGIFGKTLKRPADFAARWGGEEFIVLLPNTDSHGALEIAEKIRGNVEDMEIPSADMQKSNITVSIGVNTHCHDQNTFVINDFISGADKALYDAKDAGRNRVCQYSGT
ncbi:MAG: diguanylate cyclase [Treponema sp.]|nr:diguanylate cyclase [Treponema sp.]MCL2271490.1 diguanylate cyclase [Treponema sp.]